jgi:protein-S-isoprenylcysteine O-methyltransferase Ste14
MILRVVLPSAFAFILLVAVALPLARLRARAGVWGVVLGGDPSPLARVAHVAFGLLAAAALSWTAAYAAMGPERLGVWPAPSWLGWTGGALVATGVPIVVVAQVQMGASWRIGIDRRPTALVDRGLFGLVRNPIYAAMVLAAIGAALVAPTAGTLSAAFGLAAIVSLQTRLEERHLARLHGAAYARYAAKVGRFVPFVGRIRAV